MLDGGGAAISRRKAGMAEDSGDRRIGLHSQANGAGGRDPRGEKDGASGGCKSGFEGILYVA